MNWLEVDQVSVLTGKDSNGNRYLSQFLKEYKEVFNRETINAGCQKCLVNYYLKFIKYLHTMPTPKQPTEYRLKAKYNGIPLSFGSPVQVDNNNMTDAYGNQLLENHPKGADLFDAVPDTSKNQEDLSTLSRKQLNKRAVEIGLNPDDYKNKSEVVNAISEALKTQVSDEEE